MAEAEDAHDRRRLFDMLASQIEVAFDNQANSTQVVLWDVQEAAYKKIDALHEHQSDTNLLLASVAESLAAIQGSVQQVLAAHKETARGLKKLSTEVHSLSKRMVASEADRKNIHSEVAGVKGDVADVRSDVAALQRQFESYVQGFNVEEVRTQLREMRGEYTQEQRERYTAIILDMIAAWEADHGQR